MGTLLSAIILVLAVVVIVIGLAAGVFVASFIRGLSSPNDER
jgi:hypothetical protein